MLTLSRAADSESVAQHAKHALVEPRLLTVGRCNKKDRILRSWCTSRVSEEKTIKYCFFERCRPKNVRDEPSVSRRNIATFDGDWGTNPGPLHTAPRGISRRAEQYESPCASTTNLLLLLPAQRIKSLPLGVWCVKKEKQTV